MESEDFFIVREANLSKLIGLFTISSMLSIFARRDDLQLWAVWLLPRYIFAIQLPQTLKNSRRLASFVGGRPRFFIIVFRYCNPPVLATLQMRQVHCCIDRKAVGLLGS